MSLYQKSKELREERAKNWEDQKSLQKIAKDESRALSSEEQEKWDKIEGRQAELEGQIDQVESEITSQEERQAKLDAFDPMAVEGRDTLEPAPKPSAREAFDLWAREGRSELSAEQRSVLGHGQNKLGIKRAGDMVTIDLRAQSTTPAEGGVTIAEDSSFRSSVVEAMKAFGGLRSVARIIPSDDGADLPIPTSDETTVEGELLGENIEAAEEDVAFSSVTLQAYKYSSKVVRVSMELLQDTAIDLNAWLGQALGTRIGRITNRHFSTGLGVSEPNGVLTAATSGLTAGSATVYDYAEFLALKHSVDPAYRNNGSWMMNDNSLLAVKQLAVGSNDARPLWQPGIAVGEPSTIDGDPYTINQDFPDAAIDATPVAYGDFSKYMIRDVAAISVLRLVERYAEYGQVGFVAFARHDGDLVDGGGGAVKKLTMAAA